MVSFQTKAYTLEALRGVMKSITIPESFIIEHRDWRNNREAVIQTALKRFETAMPLIVRSSSSFEDGSEASAAGKYLSAPNVSTAFEIGKAIEEVFGSYDRLSDKEHIFLQPMVQDVICSGVAFSRDPSSGAPYFVISYDESGSTDGVTSGTNREPKTKIILKSALSQVDAGPFRNLCDSISELEKLLANDALDVEFAVSRDGRLHLLQVRPLVMDKSKPDLSADLRKSLDEIHTKIENSMCPKPFLFGSRTVFGVMPDWNPAEIIGVKPRPLALSLYKEMVTDSTWAYQRSNYGYRNLRSHPLIHSFHGCPYVDVRVDFNSFVPADVPDPLAEKMVEYYIDRLCANPWMHDKVEFEILFSCYHFDLENEVSRLRENGFTAEEIAQFTESLRRLTVNIVERHSGLWKQDLQRISTLEDRHKQVMSSSMNVIEKIYWLLEDCKRYGTLPFAGLARAGFIAVQILKSMVSCGLMNQAEYGEFMNSLNTVSGQMSRDLGSLSREPFLAIYGHLRPGTYDILSPRYDEAPESYFNWTQNQAPLQPHAFKLSIEQYERIQTELNRHRLDLDVLGLFEFLKSAIEGREHAKFIFTRNISDAISLLKKWGESFGYSAEDLSYLDITSVMKIYSSSQNPKDILEQSIQMGRKSYRLTKSLALPSLIFKADDVYAFDLMDCEPNYVTQLTVEGDLVDLTERGSLIDGKIVLIENADPGFDWIFTKGIKGFITMYGGANSHMAIRAGEMKIPAVVGAGEVNFQRWAKAKRVVIDCCNRQVKVLR